MLKERARKERIFQRYVFLILLSIEMIMSFTFLGYIHIPPLSITTAYIPIVIIACLFGPGEATVAGLFFGLGSMFKASALYVMPNDKLFSPFQSGRPLESLLLSVGTRVLFGFLIGWLYRFAKMGRFKRLWFCVLAFIASRLHAFLVYGALGVLFPESGMSAAEAFHMSANAIFLSVFCMVCVLLCDLVYHSRYVSAYRSAINAAGTEHGWSMKINAFLAAITVFVLCMAASSTLYFSDRMEYMLAAHNVTVSGEIQYDILHLQLQFLLSVLFLCLILLLVILMVYRYMKYREYLGGLDALTEIMGRRLFLDYCADCQKKADLKDGVKGWFLFLDVDHFKSINDTLGHAAGDRVLNQAAGILSRTFNGYGVVGRVGGDEFAAILEKPLSKAELEEILDGFLAEIAPILPDRTVGCSIGAYHFTFPKDVTALLSQTDLALYEAKERGRGCYVIHEEAD